MNQTMRILYYLKEGNALTSLEALEMFGCFRLGARINDLRKSGYQIESRLVQLQNKKKVAEYRLKPAKNPVVSTQRESPVSRPETRELFNFSHDQHNNLMVL